jgi:hypothetical protein
LGQLVVQRHFNSGMDCAMAGAATPLDAARPMPAVFRNSRRFMVFLPRIFTQLESPTRSDSGGTPGDQFFTLAGTSWMKPE